MHGNENYLVLYPHFNDLVANIFNIHGELRKHREKLD